MKLKTLVLGAAAALVMTACNGGSDSPEATTESFVKSLSSGDCEKALTLATGSAEEQVKASADSGCEATGDELVGDVTCETEGDKASCSCQLKNALLGENTYKYELEKVDGKWKVANYSKDMGDMMEGLEGMGDEMEGAMEQVDETLNEAVDQLEEVVEEVQTEEAH
jgi:hypothetical protein